MDSFEFVSVSSLAEEAVKRGETISRFVLNWEIEQGSASEEEIIDRMSKSWKVMKESIEEGLRKKGPTMGGLVREAAPGIKKAADSGMILKDRMSVAAAKAVATSEVNASMGLIVAAPTAGSCGIIPAALSTAQEFYDLDDKDIVLSLFTAAGIGKVISHKSSVAGADRGCQAECGSAASMAAACLVELQGGDPEKVMHAAALSLKNSLGLVCDPVGGLVEVPCIKRNAFFAANSFVAADMALSGITSFIPMDEVISAMDEIGKNMSDKYKETALGGLAVTPTALRHDAEQKNKS